eukprot:scaffold7294_cov93-Cylindrotheca_fusiformis.AAC.5
MGQYRRAVSSLSYSHPFHQRFSNSTKSSSSSKSRLLETLSIHHNTTVLDPWNVQSIAPLECNVPLDRRTRYLLQQLSELHEFGVRFSSSSSLEYLTTERCNHAIRQLMMMVQSSEAEGATTTTSHSSKHCWQRAQRARLILEHMEAFFPNQNMEEGVLESGSLLLLLPVPNHETYWNVLKLHSNKYLHGSSEIPETCHAIVQRMEEYSARFPAAAADLQPSPNTLHWNQVIIAWANSTDPKRSIKAAQIVYDLDQKGLADASSFSHGLRACVSLSSRQQQQQDETSDDDDDASSSSSFSELAVPVAQRLQNGLRAAAARTKIPLESFHFVHLLRIGRNLSDPTERDEHTLKIWNEATVECQKVNVHVLQELLQVASPKLLSEILGKDYDPDPLKLIHTLPKEWIDSNPDNSKNNPYEW